MPGGRKKNPVSTVTLTLSVSPRVKEWLEELAIAGEGTFGKSAAEVASGFVNQKIQEQLEKGTFITRKKPQ